MKVRYFLLVIRDIYEVRHFSIIILIIEVGLGQLEAVQNVCSAGRPGTPMGWTNAFWAGPGRPHQAKYGKLDADPSI